LYRSDWNAFDVALVAPAPIVTQNSTDSTER